MLPSGQIGNIARRLEVALPAASPVVPSALGGASGAGTQPLQSQPLQVRGPLDREDSPRDPWLDRSGARQRIASIPRRDRELGIVPVHLMFGQSAEAASARFGLEHLAMLGDFALALDSGPQQAQAPGPARDRGDPPAGIPGQIGATAPPGRFTFWGQGGRTHVSNTLADANYEGTARFYTLGADMRIGDGVVGGVAMGTSDTSINTYFNGGTYRESGFTVSPYVAWRPTDRLGLQLVAGASRGTIDTMRAGAVSGDTVARGWYVSLASVYRLTPASPWRIEPRANVLAGKRVVDGFSESNGAAVPAATTHTTRARVGSDLGYELRFANVAVEPFGRVEYVQDMSDAVNDDRTAFALTGGMRLLRGPVFGALEWERELGRANYVADTLSAVLGYRFDLGEDRGTLAPGFNIGDTGGFSHLGASLRYEPLPMLTFGTSVFNYAPNGRRAAVDQLAMGGGYIASGAAGATVYRTNLVFRF